MSTLLYSKNSIVKVIYSYMTVSQYKVLDSDGSHPYPYVKDNVNNCSCGWLWHFMECHNTKEFAPYVYCPSINKDYILILPYIHITFSGAETVKILFETDEQLDNFLDESGIRKMLNTTKFFNPKELANKIKDNK